MENPLEHILSDSSVTEIMIDGPNKIYVTRKGTDGKFEAVESPFSSRQHLVQFVEDVVGMVGRKVEENNPIMDMRLADGSRGHTSKHRVVGFVNHGFKPVIERLERFLRSFHAKLFFARREVSQTAFLFEGFFVWCVRIRVRLRQADRV